MRLLALLCALLLPVQAAALSCLGPWCGSVANGTEVLAFLRHGKAGYVLEVEPCGGYVFDNLPEQRRRVRDCLRGDACPE